jgi:hypothetical protein
MTVRRFILLPFLWLWKDSLAQILWRDLTPFGRCILFPILLPLAYLALYPILALAIILWLADKLKVWDLIDRLIFAFNRAFFAAYNDKDTTK